MIKITADKETQIVDEIREQIVAKSLGPGEKLPSENELADKHRIPRMTVRNALLKLEEQGVIYSEHGKGRYVKERSIQIQLHLTGKISFTDKLKQSGYDLTTRNMCCEKIGYDPKIYQILRAEADDAIYKIGRLRYIDKEPIAIHQSFVNEDRFPSIAEDGSEIKSMFAYYRKHGLKKFASNKSLLSITFPTSYEKELLSCNSLVPLIMVESDCIDVDSGNVLEHTKILYRSDMFKYDITID